MRKLMVAVAVFLALAGCMTVPTVYPKDWSRVYAVEKNSGTIFDLSMRWLALTFKSSKAVIEYANEERGIIIGNGIIAGTDLTIMLEVRNGGARLTFSNFIGANTVSTKYGNFTYKTPWENLQEELEGFAADYGEYVSSTVTGW